MSSQSRKGSGKSAAPVGSPTPLRARVVEVTDGCRVLSRPGLAYRDGGEDRVVEILEGATDRTSLSDELEGEASTWAERYHLTKSRGNLIRPLLLSPDARVLEIGAGCGGVTRLLGERCAVVDAIEPVPQRARAARARTMDLPGVEVFVGMLDDVPADPSYDLVTLVGVLEYVAEGRPGLAEYAAYVREAALRLRPGGTLLIAIENRIGVKYLAGAREDHTNRLFDGLEDYPRGGHARCFTRRELASIVEAGGLAPRFLHAFPDYKLPRVLFNDELLEAGTVQPLAWELPKFPSPAWLGPGAVVADERRLWRSLVGAGLGGQFSNSFVVLATAPGERGATPLWPDDQLACFYNTNRRRVFTTETRVVRPGEGPARLEQRLLGAEGRSVERPGLMLEAKTWPYVEGRTLLEELASCPLDAVPLWLLRWRRLVGPLVREDDARAPVDLVPHNLVVVGDRLVPIDLEWSCSGYTEADLIGRGVFWLAVMVAELSVPERWSAATVRDLAVALGRQAGLEPDGSWLDPVLHREATFQAQVYDCEPASGRWEAAVAHRLNELRASLDRRLEHMPLGIRDSDRLTDAEARLAHAATVLRGYEADIEHLRANVARQSEELSAAAQRDQEAAAREAGVRADLARSGAALDELRDQLAELEERWRRLESRLPVRLYREAQALRRRLERP